MKVILLQDVKKLGSKGDVVEVSDGYGRNYLIPRGLAVAADASNVRQLKHEQKVEQRKEARELQEAKELKRQLEELSVTLDVKSGDKGRLFGSVTTGDIAEAVKKSTNIKLDRRKIELPDPIKSVGEYSIAVRVYPEVTAQLKVVVRAV